MRLQPIFTNTITSTIPNFLPPFLFFCFWLCVILQFSINTFSGLIVLGLCNSSLSGLLVTFAIYFTLWCSFPYNVVTREAKALFGMAFLAGMAGSRSHLN